MAPFFTSMPCAFINSMYHSLPTIRVHATDERAREHTVSETVHAHRVHRPLRPVRRPNVRELVRQRAKERLGLMEQLFAKNANPSANACSPAVHTYRPCRRGATSSPPPRVASPTTQVHRVLPLSDNRQGHHAARHAIRVDDVSRSQSPVNSSADPHRCFHANARRPHGHRRALNACTRARRRSRNIHCRRRGPSSHDR